MKRFLLKLAIFSAPLLGAWLFLEWKFSHTENTETVYLYHHFLGWNPLPRTNRPPKRW